MDSLAGYDFEKSAIEITFFGEKMLHCATQAKYVYYNDLNSAGVPV